MNKWDFIKAVAEKCSKSQTEVDSVIKAASAVIVEQVRDNGESIAISGLGTFKQKATEAHEGRNPFSGEKMMVKASRNIKFTPQSTLKVAIEEKPSKAKKAKK